MIIQFSIAILGYILKATIILTSIAPTQPPMRPSTLLFGDTLGKSFLFPKFTPIRYAKLSLAHINRNMETSSFEELFTKLASAILVISIKPPVRYKKLRPYL